MVSAPTVSRPPAPDRAGDALAPVALPCAAAAVMHPPVHRTQSPHRIERRDLAQATKKGFAKDFVRVARATVPPRPASLEFRATCPFVRPSGLHRVAGASVTRLPRSRSKGVRKLRLRASAACRARQRKSPARAGLSRPATHGYFRVVPMNSISTRRSGCRHATSFLFLRFSAPIFLHVFPVTGCFSPLPSV